MSGHTRTMWISCVDSLSRACTCLLREALRGSHGVQSAWKGLVQGCPADSCSARVGLTALLSALGTSQPGQNV